MYKPNSSPRRGLGATGILLIAIFLLFASLFPHAPAAKIKLHSFQEPNLTNGDIAFTEENQEGNADVFSVKPDGTALTNLSNTPAAYNDLPVWSSDGSKIAFESSRDDPENYFFQIYVMTPAGSGQTRLTNNPGDNFNPVWSPDGSKIAFMNFDNGNTEIFVMNSDGTGQQNLTNNAAYDFIGAWSPDSSRIAFESDRDGNVEIYEMNADGSNPVNLSNDFGGDRSPSWSPDGNRIVFTSSREGNSQIYVMNADGGGQVRLTNNSAQDRNPIWSPTGAMIVFIQSDAEGTRLRAMNTDGSGQVNLTDSSHSPNNFVWSPDGARLAFDSNVNGEMDIYVVDADASNLQRLTTSATRSIGPVWQPVFVAPPTPTPTPAATFGNVEINPDAIFVNEPGVVTVRSRISFDPGEGAATLALQRLDSSGAVLGNEGNLTDDGNIDNGDELAGDGIFSVKREFVSQVAGAISLRIHFEQNLQTADSRTASLDVFEHLTGADMQSAMDIMGSARQMYFSLLPGLGPQASRDVVISQLESNSHVRRVGGTEVSGNNIWIVFKSDIQGQLYLNPQGTRGGGRSAANAAPTMPVQAGGGAGERIKNSKAIVLSPMLHEFGVLDEGPSLEQMLRNSSCPTCDVTYLADTDVTVDVLRSVYAYGIVAISSHGVVGPGGQVTFMSGQHASNAPPTTIQIDMLKKRVGIGSVASGYFYTIFPSFVRHYAASKYPNSLVYIGSCFSNNNNTLANAFLNKGAKTYLGYSESVDSGFAKTASLDFFNRFIENANIRTTGEAFIPGQNGGESPPAFFQMVGSTSLRVPQSSADLFHDSFDSPPTGSNTYNPILDGWNSCCLFAPRKYSMFAAQQPVDGQYMAMVTARYNGWMDSAGGISKFVCLPANTRKLKFSWNIITNNYRQTCSTSADYFYVDVFRSGPGPNRQVYFTRYVSDSCGMFNPIPMSSDLGHRSGATGWRSTTLDVSGLALSNTGKTVYIGFGMGANGTPGDTATLIDKVEFTGP